MKISVVPFVIVILIVIGFSAIISQRVTLNQPVNIPPPLPPELSLELSPFPLVDQEANLAFQVRARQNKEGVVIRYSMPSALEIRVVLPEGIKLIAGDSKRRYYNISDNDIIKHEIGISVTKTGNYTIKGVAIEGFESKIVSPGGPPWDWTKELCISVGKTKTEVIDCHPRPLPLLNN